MSVFAQPNKIMAEGEALLRARELDAAWSAYDQAQRTGADADRCSAGRWMVATLRGDFEAAWRESDQIRARGKKDPNRFWQGEQFDGKRVILRCLHGHGDTVQMMRYVPLIRERANHLIVEVAPAMLELARMFDGIDEVITWGPQAPNKIPAWDVQIEINELPYVFRTQSKDLPIASPYLSLPTRLSEAIKAHARVHGNLRVGLVWASGDWNPSRSVPSALVERLLATSGVEFWNLQGGSARSQWKRFAKGAHLHDAEDCANSMGHLAAFIDQLDLVITPDTLAAHLAGALGTAAWVMLEYAADWRWQHGRSDSPWYPTLRLFRQAELGEWEDVLASVESELELLSIRYGKRQRAA